MGSPRSLGVVAAAAVSWTCSVYDPALLSTQGVTTGGAPIVTAGAAGSTFGGAATGASGSTNVAPGGTAGTEHLGGGSAPAEPGPGGGGALPAEGGAAGAAGESGVAPPTCEDAPIPLKGSWRADASHSSLGSGGEYDNPPENLMDLSPKRWSTGKAQAGDEWFQIDFGSRAAVRELSFTLNPDDAEDYPRNYQIKLSDEPKDFNAPIRASGAGALGQTLVVTLAEPVAARYLLVQQKGKDASAWWSVSELSVKCF